MPPQRAYLQFGCLDKPLTYLVPIDFKVAYNQQNKTQMKTVD